MSAWVLLCLWLVGARALTCAEMGDNSSCVLDVRLEGQCIRNADDSVCTNTSTACGAVGIFKPAICQSLWHCLYTGRSAQCDALVDPPVDECWAWSQDAYTCLTQSNRTCQWSNHHSRCVLRPNCTHHADQTTCLTHAGCDWHGGGINCTEVDSTGEPCNTLNLTTGECASSTWPRSCQPVDTHCRRVEYGPDSVYPLVADPGLAAFCSTDYGVTPLDFLCPATLGHTCVSECGTGVQAGVCAPPPGLGSYGVDLIPAGCAPVLGKGLCSWLGGGTNQTLCSDPVFFPTDECAWDTELELCVHHTLVTPLPVQEEVATPTPSSDVPNLDGGSDSLSTGLVVAIVLTSVFGVAAALGVGYVLYTNPKYWPTQVKARVKAMRKRKYRRKHPPVAPKAAQDPPPLSPASYRLLASGPHGM